MWGDSQSERKRSLGYYVDFRWTEQVTHLYPFLKEENQVGME